MRVVVEANLRESFQAQDLRGLFSLDGLRRGSAPYDRTPDRPPSPVECKGEMMKGKARDDGEIVGWDWTDVTGVCKCVSCAPRTLGRPNWSLPSGAVSAGWITAI